MTCREWETWISAYHDNGLDGERRRRVEQHLEACARCRAESEATRRLEQALRRAMTPSEAPETLFARVMTGLPRVAPGASRRRPAPRMPRNWLFFGLAPVGIALGLLIAAPRTPPPADPVALVRAPAGVGGTARPGTAKPPPAGRRAPSAERRLSAPGEKKASPAKPPPPPAPESRPELEPLRRLVNPRPPRPRDTYAHNRPAGPGDERGERASSTGPSERVHGRGTPVAASPPRSPSRVSASRHATRAASPRAESRRIVRRAPSDSRSPSRQRTVHPQPPEGAATASWLSVVDYVLPQATPERTPAEAAEFVLRAVETCQVARTSYEY